MSERKVPKIRFPGFTDEWEKRELLDCLIQPISDGPHETPNLVDEGIPFISVDAIVDNKINFERKRGYITEEYDLECRKKYSPQREDVYLVKSGSTVGKVAIVETDERFNIWSPLAAMRVNKEVLLPKYLYYFLQLDDIQDEISAKSRGGTQPNLSMRILEKFIVRLPDIDEQKKISDSLNQLDILITLHQQECDKLKELKKGMLQKMFPKEGESVPEIRFPGFEGQWKRYKLEEVTDEFRSGTFIAATDIVDDGEYPVYGGNGLRGYANTFNHDGEFALIGRQGALCGNVNYSYGKAYFTEHAVAVKANSSANTKFLFYLLDLMKLGQYSDQSAQPGLAVGKLIKLENMFPSKQEQKRISNLFSLLDMIISNLQGEVMKWQSLKKALLQQMFV